MSYFIQKYRFIALFCVIFACLTSAAALPDTPVKHEVRAVWLTTIGGLDWPHSYALSEESASRQKKELCDILDQLKHANINTVLLQTRIRATTIYPSALEPWDGCVSVTPGKSPGYDPLQFAIDECHKRGMEIHAWVVTIPVGKWNAIGCKRLRAKYPKMLKKIGGEGYMNPESQLTATYLASICREITQNYDIDGIHLDYIRYPENWRFDKRFNRNIGRANITRIVRSVHNAVKVIKPWVKLSCSPIGKYDDLSRYWSYGWNAYNKVCQDAQGWLRDGLMDELFPMMYFEGNQFYPFAIDWKENSHGRIVCPGLGIYFLSPKEKDWSLDEIRRQMNFLRKEGMGHAFFRSKFLTDDVKGIYQLTCNDINQYPALIPPMTWESMKKPEQPQLLNVRRTDEADWLTWSDPKSKLTERLEYHLFNVYASAGYPVDITDPRNIVATRVTEQRMLIPHATNDFGINYAVTAIDRYGNESHPTMTAPAEKQKYKSRMTLLNNDGSKLSLPDTKQFLDADYITIETLQGMTVATRANSGSTIDISRLPDGIYIARSMGRKGAPHRLGYFIVRRK